MNRDSANVSANTIHGAPTITDSGLELTPSFVAGGTGGNAPGGEGISSKLILGTNKNYLFRITNVSGIATTISTKLEWYEKVS